MRDACRLYRIWQHQIKYTKQMLRNGRIEHVLDKFRDLDRLTRHARAPVHPCFATKEEECPGPDEFTTFLENIFASDFGFESPRLKTLVREIKATGFEDIERFTMVALQDALKHLRRNKCADSKGIVAECCSRSPRRRCFFFFFSSLMPFCRDRSQVKELFYWSASRHWDCFYTGQSPAVQSPRQSPLTNQGGCGGSRLGCVGSGGSCARRSLRDGGSPSRL